MTNDFAHSFNLPWGALAGPAVAGACMGLGVGLGAVAQWAVALPGLILCVAALGLPALYIATTLTGDAPALGRVTRCALVALDRAGLVLLGLSPALAFMVVTTQNEATVVLSTLAVSVASLLALRGLFVGLFAADRTLSKVPSSTVLAYLAWSAVVLGIGCHWFVSRAFETLGGVG